VGIAGGLFVVGFAFLFYLVLCVWKNNFVLFRLAGAQIKSSRCSLLVLAAWVSFFSE
jgi:hypothetical protein